MFCGGRRGHQPPNWGRLTQQLMTETRSHSAWPSAGYLSKQPPSLPLARHPDGRTAGTSPNCGPAPQSPHCRHQSQNQAHLAPAQHPAAEAALPATLVFGWVACHNKMLRAVQCQTVRCKDLTPSSNPVLCCAVQAHPVGA